MTLKKSAPVDLSAPPVDLNFAPRFRPFYEEQIGGYERQLNKLILPGELRPLTEQPHIFLQACRLRAGGLVVSMESTPFAVSHLAQHAADMRRAEFLASFIIEGHGLIAQNGASLPIAPGDIIFRTTALSSEVQLHTNARLVVVKAQLSRLLGGVGAKGGTFSAQRATAALPIVQTAHRCLGHVFFDKGEANSTSTRFAEEALIALLGAIYTSRALEEVPGGANKQQAGTWQNLTDYIDANLTDPELSVASIAASLRISSRWLHRLFQQQSLKYLDYVAEKRLCLAKAALEDPRRRTEPVKELALTCGFQDASHFNRRFSQRFGYSPSRYREQYWDIAEATR